MCRSVHINFLVLVDEWKKKFVFDWSFPSFVEYIICFYYAVKMYVPSYLELPSTFMGVKLSTVLTIYKSSLIFKFKIYTKNYI